MPVGFIGSKHTVFDIYPLRQKKVFLLVDPQNILGDTADFHATLDTITHLLDRKASVVIAASYGQLAGITLNLSKKEREGAIDAFQREGGMGYTNFFSNLAPVVKVEVLNSIPGLALSRELGKSSPNTGKTTLFAGLATERKVEALNRFFSKREFQPCSTYAFVDALQGRFPGVKVHFSPDCVRAPLHTVAPGEIMVLENLRFYRNEMSRVAEERQAMAEVLAAGVDLFINDSFGTAYGVYASNVELPRLMQHGAAGQSMDRELAFYSKFLSHPGRPLAVVIAGSNIASKLQLIRSLLGRVDRIFVAGDAAFPFLVAQGLPCGLNYPLDSEPTIRVMAHDGGPSLRHQNRHSSSHHRHSHRQAASGKGGRHGGAAANGGGNSNHHSSVNPQGRRGGKAEHGNGTVGANGFIAAGAGAAVNGGGTGGGATGSAHANGGPSSSSAPAATGNANGKRNAAVGLPADTVDVISTSVLSETSLRYAGRDDEVPCSVYARELLDLCEQYDVEIFLPIDHIVATSPDGDKAKAVLVESPGVPSDVYAMDCGINTVNLFARGLRDCRTVFWTGALGWATKGYTAGTRAFASALAQLGIISIVGGRYTAQVVHEAGVTGKILHVSSGGVSSLEVLQGNPLPGVQALSDVAFQTEVSTVSINELVRNLPMFIGCNSHQLKLVAKKLMRRVLSKGDYLLYRGDRHACLTLVAQGGLIARCAEEYTSAPARYIPRGMTAGTYSFITQAPAMETIRAAQDETVVYQFYSSSMNELLNAHPDLAAQLFQNLSEPLRLIANDEYRTQQSNEQVVRRNACRTRVPVLANVPATAGTWEDIAQDVISTVTLQTLTMQFTPYVARLDVELPVELQPPVPGPIGRAFGSLSRHDGLGTALVASVVRNMLYHQLVHYASQPWVASVLSSAATAPLRLLAYGIKYNDINFKLVLDEGLIDAAAAVAPLLAYRAALEVQLCVERFRKRRMNGLGRWAVMSLVKLLLGLAVFPVVYQRNFVYTQPSASRFWEPTAFRAYQLKQVLSLLLRYLVHKTIKALTG